jgi:hypothetical protein
MASYHEEYREWVEPPQAVWDQRRLYETCEGHLGQRVDVAGGELVFVPDGRLVISQTVKPDCILLVESKKLALPLSALQIALPYARMDQDCAALCARWQDRVHGTDMFQKYKKLRFREYLAALDGGIVDYMVAWGMQEVPVDQIQRDDVLLYRLTEDHAPQSHIAIYLGEGQILHQVPFMLSGTEQMDTARVMGAFRYVQ